MTAASPRGYAIEFKVLGPLTVRLASEPVDLPQAMLRRLLALLLCRANGTTSIDAIADALWGGSPPRSARKAVHVYMHRLRRALGNDGRIAFGPGGYRLLVAAAELDAELFADRVRKAAAARDQGDLRSAAIGLREALALWRGPAYNGADEMPVVRTEAERLDELRLAALEERISIDLELGGGGELIDELLRAIAAHPYRERLRGLLMLALYRAGRQVDALLAYRDTRELLISDLGVEPSPDLQDLHRRILEQDAGLAGTVRLVGAAGGGRPPAEEPAVAWRPPAPLADFVGRGSELDGIAEYMLGCLDGGRTPIVAISGLPGVGKSVLAIAAGYQLRQRFPAGQLYVDLHGNAVGRTPEEVLARFLRALGVPVTAIPDDLEEAAELYRERLSAAPRLVILDNAASVAQILPLLPPMEGAVLVTSRRLLADLDGARFVQLQPLPEAEAIGLFTRATGIEPALAAHTACVTIVHLCGRLPLAIRIVSAKVLRGTSLGDLADQLSGAVHLLDHFASGERSVRATLQTAYETLPEQQRRLLCYLAIVTVDDFPGWLAHVALEAEPLTGMYELDQLVASSLVETLGTDGAGQSRYRLHDVVRHFAAEQARQTVGAEERTGAIARVAGAWHTLAEQADRMITHQGVPTPALTTATAPAATGAHLRDSEAWFAAEWQSVVAIAQLSALTGLDTQCWQLIWNCESYLRQEARIRELNSLGQLALDCAERIGDRLGIACACLTLAATSEIAGDAIAGENFAKESLAAADEIGHPWLRAEIRGVLSWIYAAQGRTDEQVQTLHEAVDLYADAGEAVSRATKLTQLAEIFAATGDCQSATAYFEQGLALLREAGAPIPLARGLRRLARFQWKAGDLVPAIDTYTRCLELLHDFDESMGKLCIHTELALVLLDTGETGDVEEAARHLDLAQKLSERSPSAQMYAAFVRMGGGILSARQGKPAQARAILEAVVGEIAGNQVWQAIARRELAQLPLR